jgi:hypothetical protein
VLGLCIVAYPLVDRLGTRAEAGIPAAGAVAAAALAQDPPEPTIVWYGTDSLSYGWNGFSYSVTVVTRAWSTGRVESKWFRKEIRNGAGQDTMCQPVGDCDSGWIIVNNPSQGLTFDADLNFDQAVDGVDLGELLSKWGPAPRNPVPPSDCPLALINP